MIFVLIFSFFLNSSVITPPLVNSFDINTIKSKIDIKSPNYNELNFMLAVAYIKESKFEQAYRVIKNVKPISGIEDYVEFYKAKATYEYFHEVSSLLEPINTFYKLSFDSSKNLVEKVKIELSKAEFKLAKAYALNKKYDDSIVYLIRAQQRGFSDFEQEFHLYRLFIPYNRSVAVQSLIALYNKNKEKFDELIKYLPDDIAKEIILKSERKTKLTYSSYYVEKDVERKVYENLKLNIKSNNIDKVKELSTEYFTDYTNGFYYKEAENLVLDFLIRIITSKKKNIKYFKSLFDVLDYELLEKLCVNLWRSDFWSESKYLTNFISEKFLHNPKARYLLASIYEDNGERLKAIELYSGVVKAFPLSLRYYDRALFKVAWLNYLEGRYEESVKIFKRFLDEAGDNIDWDITASLYFLSRSYRKLLKNEEAFKTLEELYFRYPYSFYSLFSREELGISTVKELEKDLSDIPNMTTDSAITPRELFFLNKAKVLIKVALIDDAANELSSVDMKNMSYYYLDLVISIYKYSSYPNMAISESYNILREYKGYISKEHLKNHFPILYKDLIEKNAKKHGIDPYIIYSLIKRESGFKEDVLSNAGALGLMQIMPGTAKKIDKSISSDKLKIAKENIRIGTEYFAKLMEENSGNLIYSLAMYNAGEIPVRNWKRWYKKNSNVEFIESIPFRETRDYVRSVLANYYMYNAIYRKKSISFKDME